MISESPARGGDPTLPRAGTDRDHRVACAGDDPTPSRAGTNQNDEWDDLVKWKNKKGGDEPWSSQPFFPETI